MTQNVKLPVDAEMIKALIEEKKITYKDIEEMTDGSITEFMLKHFLNRGLKADETTLDTLAALLDCSKNDLVSKDYLLSMNLSFEINQIVGDLYLKNREDINQYYASEIKKFRNNNDLRTMLNQSHRLFLALSSIDFVFDKSAFSKAFGIIGTDFISERCICNMQLTGLQDTIADNFFAKIVTASGEYNTQQVILMLLYAFILFDAIFLEEAVASVCQLVPQRKTEKANQYYELTYRSEKMRDALIDNILYKGLQFDHPSIIELGVDDKVIENIALMLAACEKCFQHINGNYTKSEYINRASLSAILTHLEKVFLTVGIKLPEDYFFNEYVNMNISRFGIQYNLLKAIFNDFKPPRKPIDKGQQGIINGMVLQYMMDHPNG